MIELGTGPAKLVSAQDQCRKPGLSNQAGKSNNFRQVKIYAGNIGPEQTITINKL